MSTATRHVLQRLIQLGESERQAVIRIMMAQQHFPSNRDLVRAGTPLPGVYLMLSGFACRYVTFEGGQRQILGYLLPGDVFDVRACFAQKTDFSVQSLSKVCVATIPGFELMALTHRFPQLLWELWRLAAMDDAVTRQWQLNVGRRSAIQRLSHLLCECFARLSAAGVATGSSCPMPMTQTDLADALALTPVHVNRTLTQLRKAGFAVLQGHRLTILDQPALCGIAEFEPGYLQLTANCSEASVARAGTPASAPRTHFPDSGPRCAR